MAIEAGWRYIPGADPSWTMEQIEAHVNKWTPLGRIGNPEDIARVVRFLVSEDGGWMNGRRHAPGWLMNVTNIQISRTNHYHFWGCY